MADVEAIMPEGKTPSLPSPLPKDDLVTKVDKELPIKPAAAIAPAIVDDQPALPVKASIGNSTSNEANTIIASAKKDAAIAKTAIITDKPEAMDVDEDEDDDDDDHQQDDDDSDDNANHNDKKITSSLEDVIVAAKTTTKDSSPTNAATAAVPNLEENGMDVDKTPAVVEKKSAVDGSGVGKRTPLSSVENSKETAEESTEEAEKVSSDLSDHEITKSDNAITKTDVTPTQPTGNKCDSTDGDSPKRCTANVLVEDEEDKEPAKSTKLVDVEEGKTTKDSKTTTSSIAIDADKEKPPVRSSSPSETSKPNDRTRQNAKQTEAKVDVKKSNDVAANTTKHLPKDNLNGKAAASETVKSSVTALKATPTTEANSDEKDIIPVSDSEVEEATSAEDLSATNGVTKKSLKSQPPAPPTIDNNVVDLDDDDDDDDSDDEEMSIVPNHINHRADTSAMATTEAANKITIPDTPPSKSYARLSNDSEGAVIINSDSENEGAATIRAPLPAPLTAPANALIAPILSTAMTQETNATKSSAAAAVPTHGANHHAGLGANDHNDNGNNDDDDDDDDDCVVIEDDTPAPAPPTVSDLNKRKSTVLDGNLDYAGDETQPPNKRQRSGVGFAPSAASSPAAMAHNQIQIKDARSLMAPEVIGTKRAADGSVFPITITTAHNSTPVGNMSTTMTATSAMGGGGGVGPPKLVPMAGNANAMANTMPGLTGMNCNANLLPGLTDDMFVLEAPSFIVPYIYEKPPIDILKDVIRDIETKHKFSKEDLADADKGDEFDMMTEQNKEEKEKEERKKKRKRRGRDDGDDSWSEDSDDDEYDDDDSESGMRTKVLIKEASDDLTALKGVIKSASAVTQSSASATPAVGAKPGQENYFESPLGKFFMDIGVGLVQEFVQSDLIRLQKRKMRKSLGKNINEFERAITALSGNLEASKKKNSPFKFTMKRCEFCNFKSESALSMANHYETPHMHGILYKCNFCTFEIRNATEIVYHMEAVHNIKARLIKPLPYHQCPNCGFEDNGKAKLARHQPVCAKKFRPELNLAPPTDWEAPAKIPRIKPRHGLVGTATAYQAMAAQAAAQKAALASIQQQQQQAAQARSLQAAALAAQTAANKLRGRPPVVAPPKPPVPVPASMVRGPSQVRNPMATNLVMPNYQLTSTQLIQNATAMVKKNLSGQPSISITPLPRQTAATPQAASPSTSKLPQAGVKPGQAPNTAGKTQFVICEICDGYIKDLEQLRNHMQWMHKVKIHPKMIYNRPPLNCQKCQFRFFTDQGLERHLLGSHGLVTSSMQEAANKGKDAGRCPVCGRMYQWKLLNHVSRDHHMTLKPAHLSYKCTVCTATFGMYKQFETHVYTAHSTVAKKAMDSKKNNNAPSSTAAPNSNSGGNNLSQRNSALSAANDSLLKPLKINDEITIIPQPASKTRITNMESHVID